MPGRRKSEARAEKPPESGVDILSFFAEGGARPLETGAKAPTPSGGLEQAITSFLRSRGGKVAKSELYRWAKNRGIAPAALYAAISNMLKSGTLRRVFDESAQEVAFVLA